MGNFCHYWSGPCWHGDQHEAISAGERSHLEGNRLWWLEIRGISSQIGSKLSGEKAYDR